MEQRIGSNNQPLAAAAVDPSHIPGLTAPVSVKKEKQEEPEDIKPTESAEAEAGAEADAEEATEAEAETEDATGAGAAADDATGAAADDAAEAETESGAPTDGPAFEASDRRAKITADSAGVRLRLDDQECEFGWDEIGAIETESPRFGKRFTITVHTPDRRWYFLEIEAKAKSEHAAWEKQIDAVLDAYFDDGAEDKEAEDKEAEEDAP